MDPPPQVPDDSHLPTRGTTRRATAVTSAGCTDVYKDTEPASSAARRDALLDPEVLCCGAGKGVAAGAAALIAAPTIGAMESGAAGFAKGAAAGPPPSQSAAYASSDPVQTALNLTLT